MVILLSLMGCTNPPDSPRVTIPDVARTAEPDPVPPESLVRPALTSPGWELDAPVSECRWTDGDSDLVQHIQLNAEGDRVRVEHGDGRITRFYRLRRMDGTLWKVQLWSWQPTHPDGFLAWEEEYDAQGRLVAAAVPHMYFEYQWTYDAGGRLTSETIVDADYIERTYGYTADGNLTSRGETWNTWHSSKGWRWSGSVLRETWSSSGSDGGKSVDWEIHDDGSRPTYGRGSSWSSDGSESSWTEYWSYDAAGHPVEHRADVSEDTRSTWVWDGDHLVGSAQYAYDAGVERLVREVRLVRDEEGRLIEHRRDGELVESFVWDEDGDISVCTDHWHERHYEGDCPPELFGIDPWGPRVTGPFPTPPEPPRPSPG